MSAHVTGALVSLVSFCTLCRKKPVLPERTHAAPYLGPSALSQPSDERWERSQSTKDFALAIGSQVNVHLGIP